MNESPRKPREVQQVSPVVGERYEVLRPLGAGSQGWTFLARDHQRGEEVALKELDLSQADDWKAVELFEREGRVLSHLNHRGIPRYVDAFHHSDEEGKERFFLVQEYVEGDDLAELMEQGKNWSEAEVKDVIRQVLEILVYLQDRSPPVIHRDIKPSNLILRRDGTVVLIDFGAVQSVIPDSGGGSTIIGTTGYMSVEQLMGRAVPATDLYALGATAIHLLSRRHPNELPVENMRLSFRSFVNISDGFSSYLEQLVEPDVQKRFSTAREALEALRALDRPADPPAITRSHSTGAEPPPVIEMRRIDRFMMGIGGKLALVAGVGLFLVALAFPITNCGRISGKVMGYNEIVEAPLYECDIVAEELGENIRIPVIGFQNGQTSSGSSTGSAAWRYPVAGDDRRATYRFTARLSNGHWRLTSARLVVDGRQIDLMDC